jgi:hypothetical protein
VSFCFNQSKRGLTAHLGGDRQWVCFLLPQQIAEEDQDVLHMVGIDPDTGGVIVEVVSFTASLGVSLFFFLSLSLGLVSAFSLSLFPSLSHTHCLFLAFLSVLLPSPAGM